MTVYLQKPNYQCNLFNTFPMLPYAKEAVVYSKIRPNDDITLWFVDRFYVKAVFHDLFLHEIYTTTHCTYVRPCHRLGPKGLYTSRLDTLASMPQPLVLN